MLSIAMLLVRIIVDRSYIPLLIIAIPWFFVKPLWWNGSPYDCWWRIQGFQADPYQAGELV